VNSSYWTNDSLRNEKILISDGWVYYVYVIGSSFTHLSSLENFNSKDSLLEYIDLDSANAIISSFNTLHMTDLSIDSTIKEIIFHLPKVVKKMIDNANYSINEIEKRKCIL